MPAVPASGTSFVHGLLADFSQFHQTVNLTKVFEVRDRVLADYFDRNKAKGRHKSSIFYVKQAGRLQCLNGAYLSDVDDELFGLLFGQPDHTSTSGVLQPTVSVETGIQVTTIRSRQGQSKFAAEIKALYNGRCCFPGCSVADARLLIASHIARWADNEDLRGHLGNGLCLCVFHDKAFDLGLFTLDDQYRVFVNPRERSAQCPSVRELLSSQGAEIKTAGIKPLPAALQEHRSRVDIDPHA